MEKKNITPGQWKVAHIYYVQSSFEGNVFSICDTDSENESDAELIAEAGTVFHESGLTPRELLTQRNELRKVCAEMLNEIYSAPKDWLMSGSIDSYAARLERAISLIDKLNSMLPKSETKS